MQGNRIISSYHGGGGKKMLGVEFAPLSIPMARRLQTFAVASWILTFFIMGPGSLFLLMYLLLHPGHTLVRALPLVYAVWFLLDRHTPNEGGRRCDWVRHWRLWTWYCDYFPIKLVKTGDLPPHKNYIFCSHPHGILCSAAFGNFATEGTSFSENFPGITPHLLTLEGHYSFPLYREYLMSSGACSASKRSLNYLLSRPGGGHAAVLVVGGAPESLESRPGSYILKLKDRKGFIKTALRHGASLVPIFSFGEIEIYTQVHFPTGSKRKRIQSRLQRVLGLAPCLFNGRGIFQYSFGIIPQRRPLTTVVGEPIDVPKTADPTSADIDALHAKYVASLQKLFYTYRDLYATPETELIII
ncbi:2-acylglycerol O-acyltransferase 1 isoform X2 [Folsomia candida]|uniref:2-acylglycerol O-acyltransferase 1 isoform X2 n=1 Tax=Folsomia candida TaxID=158441 RepID=UPI000B9077FE|nr:2-acylglycerol O-acyltransferase 1 isoform X2 [Folsomia candida]